MLYVIKFHFQIISRYLGEGEFLPQNSFIRFLARYGCDIDVAEEKVCANALFVLAGFDTSMFNYVSNIHFL